MAYVKRIGDRKYLIRVSKGTGKLRRWVNVTFRGTLAQAREHARNKETLLDSGVAVESALTFDKYFAKWLHAIREKVSPRTLDGYKGYIERYAVKSLSRLSLSDIKTHHIQSVYPQKSPTTVRNLHAALNACFSYAVKKEYLTRNPCKGTDLPQKSKKNLAVMTESEAGRFIASTYGREFGIVFHFALMTGMRPEEYLALRWEDIDGRSIVVNRALVFNRSGGGFYFAKPKTSKSRRRIPISDVMVERLKSHRREQNELRLSQKIWRDLDLVFPNQIGNPMPINNLTRRYLAPILEHCNFDRHFTLYSLRHSCATLLLMSDENPKVVAERLGHSSVTLTLDTYSHVLPHIQDRATAKLDAILNAHNMHSDDENRSDEMDLNVVKIRTKGN